ncbi:MAG: FtsX-like permease family protein [Acidobacteriota bacterium]
MSDPRLRLATAARLMRWELRGSRSRILFWTLCLAVGVGAVVGVAGLGSSLESALRREARALLAGDLAVRSNGELPDVIQQTLDAEEGLQQVRVREVLGVARRAETRPSGANSVLVAIKSIDGPYPFFGEIGFGDTTFSADAATGSLADELGDDAAVVAPELLSRLGLQIGDSILLGQEPLRIAATVVSEPDRLPGTVAIGPRLFVHRRVLDRSGITGFSGFTRNKTLLAVADGASADELAERLRTAAGENSSVRVETFADAQPSLRRELDRLENFLGLAALLSLLIGGVGIAQGVNSWISSRLDSLAILKCLGVRPREVLWLYLLQSLLLGLTGSLFGCLFGLFVLWGVPQLLADFVPADAVRLWQPTALLRGLLLGVGVALAFSLPPLLSVLRVPPNRVFRRTAQPLPGSSWLPALALLSALFTVGGLAALQSGSAMLASAFVGGVLVTVVGLTVGAYAVARVARRLIRPKQPHWLRHGLAALSRPEAGTLGAIVALGLGLFVILTMTLVQAHLEAQIEGELPSDAPSAFLVDIRPEQWAGVEQLLQDGAAESIDSVPVVRARLASIDGTPSEELVTDDNRWALAREQRVTYLDDLPDDNELVAGELWADDDLLELSLEEEYAREIGAELGSTVELRSGEQSVELRVTSLRSVQWEGFGINFFLVAEPGALDSLSQIRLAAVRLPPDAEQGVQDAVAEEYPNVLFVRIREMLDKILILLGRLLTGIRVLGGFTVLSGLAILFGAVATSHARRGQEVALMKTLGMTRLDVLRSFAVEYALVGLAASTIASAGALAAAAWVVVREMEIAWRWQPMTVAAVLVFGTLLSVIAGTLASTRALARPPIDSLRDA